MIDPLPTPPSSTDPDDFVERADEFLGSLPAFSLQAEAARVEINANMVIAVNAADVAQNAANDVTALVGASLWNAANNYATGVSAISAIDYQTYRREAPGGVDATDPASSADWTRVNGDMVRATSGAATNMTITGLIAVGITSNSRVLETPFTVTGTNPVLNPDNGTMQRWVLAANQSPTFDLSNGESFTLHVVKGAFTLTWPTVKWLGGFAPTLSPTLEDVIEFWGQNGSVWGSHGGAA